MKSLRFGILASLVLAAACGSGGSGDGGGDGDGDGDGSPDAGDPPPAEGFRITTPDIAIQPGEEVTYCYYTTLPTTREMGVKEWSSIMTPGSHHLILFFAQGASKPDGTIERDCEGLGGGGLQVPYWAYSAQTPTQVTPMPSGVGMKVPAGQKVYVQMHYLNTSDQVINAHVQIDGEAYAAAETYTPAAAFVTYSAGFTVPANGTGEAGNSCSIAAGSKFFLMSTHAHKRATLTQVTDGTTMVFESDNWEHPGATTWAAEPFFQFASNKLTYRCEYDNTGNPNAVPEGSSAATNEMCMAVGYFFPAPNGPRFCLNGFVVGG